MPGVGAGHGVHFNAVQHALDGIFVCASSEQPAEYEF